MVNTHIGELAIHAGGKDFIFRPLFCRVAELGSAKEIFQLFEDIQSPNVFGFKAALHVLNTFADEDPTEAIGEYIDTEGKLTYSHGSCPIQDVHVIGCQILKDAIIGRPTGRDKQKSKSGRPIYEFDPSEFVAVGDAHMTGKNWWSSTMIELQKAIKAKNPEEEKDDFMTRDEQRNLFDEIDSIKRKKGLIK